MSNRGVVYDLGYTPYDGERRGRRGAIITTFKDGLLRVFGIKRRARRKVLPWGLVVLASVPAVVFVGLAFLLSEFSPDVESPYGGHAEYFTYVGIIITLFIALSAPELMVPDRKDGVLSIYSSRPLLPDDYVWARTGALFTVIAAFMLIPQTLMYIGFSALDADGFFSALVGDLGEFPKIFGATAAYILGFAPIALLIAAFANRKYVASGVYLGVLLVGTILANTLVEATSLPGRRFAALFALGEHPPYVTDWIYNRSSDLVMERAGFDPWVSAVMIGVVALLCAGVMVWRYRSLM